MQLPQTFHFGSTSITIEAADTMLVVLAGAVGTSDVSAFVEHAVDWTRDKPYALFLMNVDRVSSLSPDARKTLISNGHRLPPRVIALFGGSFTTRVVFDLVERGSSLLGSKNRRIVHWPDEQSARAWIAEMRPVLSANAHALPVR